MPLIKVAINTTFKKFLFPVYKQYFAYTIFKNFNQWAGVCKDFQRISGRFGHAPDIRRFSQHCQDGDAHDWR